MIEVMNQRFKQHAVSSSSQSVDEAMVLFKGRIRFKQLNNFSTNQDRNSWKKISTGYSFHSTWQVISWFIELKIKQWLTIWCRLTWNYRIVIWRCHLKLARFCMSHVHVSRNWQISSSLWFTLARGRKHWQNVDEKQRKASGEFAAKHNVHEMLDELVWKVDSSNNAEEWSLLQEQGNHHRLTIVLNVVYSILHRTQTFLSISATFSIQCSVGRSYKKTYRHWSRCQEPGIHSSRKNCPQYSKHCCSKQPYGSKAKALVA